MFGCSGQAAQISPESEPGSQIQIVFVRRKIHLPPMNNQRHRRFVP
jgi:hypothetical protein